MIRLQVGTSEPVEVTEAADVLALLQKHIQLGHAYAVNLIDDQEGTLIVIAPYEGVEDQDSTTDL